MYQGGENDQLCPMLLNQVRGGLRIDHHWVAGEVNLVGVGLSENRKRGMKWNKCRQILLRGLLQRGEKE